MATSVTRIKIKRNDIGIGFSDVLTLSDGTALPDWDVATVKFIMRDRNGVVFSATADLDSTVGAVSYTRTEFFPTTPGVYQQEWEMRTGGTLTQTFPSDKHNEIEILEDLDNG